MSEARSYEVIVISSRGKEKKLILNENVGTQTQLTLPAGTFSPGQIYVWVVRTTLPEQGKVTTSPPAGFWVLDDAALRDVERAEHDYNSSALVLCSVYAKHGLYDDALKQVNQLRDLNRDNRFVETMYRTLYRQSGKRVGNAETGSKLR